MRKVYMSLIFGFVSVYGFCQGSVTTSPPLTANNGQSGVTFEVISTDPIIITGISNTFNSGSQSGSVWMRLGGVQGTVGVAPNVSAAGGWTQVIPNFTATGNNTTPVPIVTTTPISITIPANTPVGFFIGGGLRYQTHTGPPDVFTDGTLTVRTGTNYGYGGAAPNPIFHPRQFLGVINYDLACGINFNLSKNDEGCPGFNNGSATVDVTSATPPYTILWSTGATTPTITGIGAGTYGVTVTDVECSRTDSITLISPPNLGPEPIVGKDTVLNQPIQVYNINATNKWTYQWNVASGGFLRMGTNTHVATVQWTEPGVHQLACVVTAADGCIDSSFVDVYVDVPFSVLEAHKRGFAFFPNPAQSHIDFENIPTAATHISIYSIQGQLLREEPIKSPEMRVNIADLPPGTYMVEIIGQFKKLIKH